MRYSGRGKLGKIRNMIMVADSRLNEVSQLLGLYLRRKYPITYKPVSLPLSILSFWHLRSRALHETARTIITIMMTIPFQARDTDTNLSYFMQRKGVLSLPLSRGITMNLEQSLKGDTLNYSQKRTELSELCLKTTIIAIFVISSFDRTDDFQ